MDRAKLRQLPRTADTIERGKQPQRHQNLRIDRCAARMALDRANLLVNRGKIEALDILPDQAGRMVLRQQFIEGCCSKDKDKNQFSFRHSARSRPPEDAIKALSVGFPGRLAAAGH